MIYFKNKYLSEINSYFFFKIGQENNNMKSLSIPQYISNASSAAYTVGKRNINNKAESIKAEIQRGFGKFE